MIATLSRGGYVIKHSLIHHPVQEENQRGLGEDIRAQGDLRHGAGHHSTGMRQAEARVHEDTPQDSLCAAREGEDV